MKPKECAVVSSVLGSITLLLLSIAAFHFLGPTPLWLPMKSGGDEEFNPRYIPWLFASVPLGSLFGCIAGTRKNERPLAWWDYPVCCSVGCFVGCIPLFQAVTLLGVLHPLLVCGVGLALVGFVFWLLNRKPKTLAEQIRSFRAD